MQKVTVYCYVHNVGTVIENLIWIREPKNIKVKSFKEHTVEFS